MGFRPVRSLGLIVLSWCLRVLIRLANPRVAAVGVARHRHQLCAASCARHHRDGVHIEDDDGHRDSRARGVQQGKPPGRVYYTTSLVSTAVHIRHQLYPLPNPMSDQQAILDVAPAWWDSGVSLLLK
jgi:hypothetical protein